MEESLRYSTPQAVTSTHHNAYHHRTLRGSTHIVKLMRDKLSVFFYVISKLLDFFSACLAHVAKVTSQTLSKVSMLQPLAYVISSTLFPLPFLCPCPRLFLTLSLACGIGCLSLFGRFVIFCLIVVCFCRLCCYFVVICVLCPLHHFLLHHTWPPSSH